MDIRDERKSLEDEVDIQDEVWDFEEETDTLPLKQRILLRAKESEGLELRSLVKDLYSKQGEALLPLLEELSEEDPQNRTLWLLLAYHHFELGAHRQAQILLERYCLSAQGNADPALMTPLSYLALIYSAQAEAKKALAIEEQRYELTCALYGKDHPDARRQLSSLACSYGEMEMYDRAAELQEQVYLQWCALFGEEHPETLWQLDALADDCSYAGQTARALELYEKSYLMHLKIHGAGNYGTYSALSFYAESAKKVYGGEDPRVKELFKRLEDLKKG